MNATETLTPYSPVKKKIEWAFFICSFAFLCGLGTWQTVRLQWKEGLIAQLEQARANEMLTMQELPDSQEDYAPLRFRFAQISGVYLNKHELHMAARYHNGQLGYHLFTPLKLTDGRLLMVNRGWIPTFAKEQETRPETLAEGAQSLKVMIRTQTDRNKFTPINQPEDNIWFGRDVDEMASVTGLELLPITVDVVGEQVRQVYPVPSTGEIKLRNDHLSYAVTWFGIAIGWAVMFRIWRKRNQ